MDKIEAAARALYAVYARYMPARTWDTLGDAEQALAKSMACAALLAAAEVDEGERDVRWTDLPYGRSREPRD